MTKDISGESTLIWGIFVKNPLWTVGGYTFYENLHLFSSFQKTIRAKNSTATTKFENVIAIKRFDVINYIYFSKINENSICVFVAFA